MKQLQKTVIGYSFNEYKLTAEEVVKAVEDAGGVVYGGDYKCV